jgi:hypothetical protein
MSHLLHVLWPITSWLALMFWMNAFTPKVVMILKHDVDAVLRYAVKGPSGPFKAFDFCQLAILGIVKILFDCATDIVNSFWNTNLCKIVNKASECQEPNKLE